MYQSFENLDESKKKTILNAGFRVFGEHSYSKASVEDIVKEAGISKGSLFYYFASKKNFFLYLYEYSADTMKKLIDSPGEDGLPEYFKKTDFFERIEDIKERKMKLAIKHPYLGSFVKRAAFESSRQVHDDIQIINQKLIKERTADFFYNLYVDKFKDGIDPAMVLQLLTWCSEGCVNYVQTKNLMNTTKEQDEIDLNEVMTLYDQYVALIKRHFYKEEYL